MRPLKGVLATLILLAFAVGSYASVHSPPTEKVLTYEVVFISGGNDDSNFFANLSSLLNVVAILPEQFIITDIYEYYVPLTIGKPQKRPANYKYLNVQRYYSCPNKA